MVSKGAEGREEEGGEMGGIRRKSCTMENIPLVRIQTQTTPA